MAEVLASHLLSTFRVYYLQQGQSDQSLSSTLVDSSLPQLINAADNDLLSFAASMASTHLANDKYKESRHSVTHGAASALITIQRKIDDHKLFINFLIHVGIYKRINLEGRIELRDI